MSNFQNDIWAERKKEEIYDALEKNNIDLAIKINEELIEGVGYGLDFFDELEPDDDYEYEDEDIE